MRAVSVSRPHRLPPPGTESQLRRPTPFCFASFAADGARVGAIAGSVTIKQTRENVGVGATTTCDLLNEVEEVNFVTCGKPLHCQLTCVNRCVTALVIVSI